MENLDFNNVDVEVLDHENTDNTPQADVETEFLADNSKKISKAWQYFKRIDTGRRCPKNKNGKIIKAECKICKKQLVGSSWCGTSHLTKHYEKHLEVLDGTQTTISQQPGTGQIVNFHFNAAVARKEIIIYIQMAQQPFGFAENPHFVRMIQRAFQPSYDGISRYTCRNEIIKEFRKGKNDLITFFENFDGKVSLTSDFWSSNQKLDYVCFTAHYIDSDWILQKRIISFKLAEIPHSGVCVGYEFFYVLKEFHLENKLLSISLDNASYYTKAIEFLASDLNIPSESTKAQLLHVRCCAHIINLIVHEGLDVISHSVTKIRSLVTYIKSSTRRVKNWKESCVAKNKKELMLIPEVATRWNSCYHMLERAFEYKDVISYYLLRFERTYVEKFVDEDWINCSIYKDFLQVFDDVTLSFSSVYKPTSNVVCLQLTSIAMVFNKYQSAIDYEQKYKMAMSVMKEKFLKYWKTFPLAFGIATIFDPRIKGRGLEKMLKFLYDVEEGKKQYDSIISSARSVFSGYNLRTPSNTNTTTNVEATPSSSSNSAWDFFKRQRTDSTSASELDLYLERVEERNDENLDILEWWRKESFMSKCLANMARDFLSIQASTTASERAFSTSGRLISNYRSCLKADVIEACMCNEDWINAQRRTQEELVIQRIKEDEMILKTCDDIDDLNINN